MPWAVGSALKYARETEAKRIDKACSRIYEGFFLLADREDLADRLLRALRRRTRRRASAPDDGPPQDGEPPQDDEPVDGEPLAADSFAD